MLIIYTQLYDFKIQFNTIIFIKKTEVLTHI